METSKKQSISTEEREEIFEKLRKSVEERKEYERTARERILNDPDIQDALKKIKQQNTEHSTPVTNV